MVPGESILRDLQAQDLADGTMGPHRFCRHGNYLDHSAAAATGIMMGFLSFTGGAKALKKKRPCQASRTHPSSR